MKKDGKIVMVVIRSLFSDLEQNNDDGHIKF